MEAMPYILRGVILPLVMGGMLAYMYPSVQVYFKRASSIRGGRVNKLLDEYRIVRQSAEDPSFLITRLVFHLASLLGQLALLILVTAINLTSLLGNFLGLILYGYIAASCLVQVNMIQSIVNNAAAFDTYRDKTIANLKRLGGFPDDLDKQETEKQ